MLSMNLPQEGQRAVPFPITHPTPKTFHINVDWQPSINEVRLNAAATVFSLSQDHADTVERISHLLSIYKALQILLPDPQAADGWVRRDNQFFDNQSALEVMLGGLVADIYKVREYVNAQRGG